MTQNNGNRNDHATLIMEDPSSPQVSAPSVQSDLDAEAELATRTKLRARQKIRQNRFVIVAAGAVVFALLIFAVVSAPRMSVPRGGSAQKASRNAANGNQDAQSQAMASLGEKSLLPITDSGRPVPKESHDGYLNEQDFTPVLAKHSKSFNLVDTLSVGVDRIQRNFEPMQRQVEHRRQTQITDEQAKLIFYSAFIDGRLDAPKSLLSDVHRLYFEPEYPEFSPRTMWSLSNAFTSAFKKLDPVPQFKATAKVGEFLSQLPA